MESEILGDDLMNRHVVAAWIVDIDDATHHVVRIAFTLAPEHRVPLAVDERFTPNSHILQPPAHRIADGKPHEQAFVPCEQSPEAPARVVCEGVLPLALEPVADLRARYYAGLEHRSDRQHAPQVFGRDVRFSAVRRDERRTETEAVRHDEVGAELP